MKSRFLPALLTAGAALSVSCVHQSRTSKTAAPSSAPISVWDRQIRNALDAGDGDYQLRVLREKVAAEPDNIPVRLELANAYRQRGYHEVALEISRLAVARFPQSGEAQLALVRDLRDINRRPEAIAGLEVFLKAHPESGPEYYSWMGILRDESNLWQLGEPAHRKALELAPTVDYLHNNLGYNLLMQKKTGDAAREFEEALKLNPGSQMARNNWGSRSPSRMPPHRQWPTGNPPPTPLRRTTTWRPYGWKKGTTRRHAANWIWPSAIIGHTRRPSGTWSWWPAWTAARLR